MARKKSPTASSATAPKPMPKSIQPKGPIETLYVFVAVEPNGNESITAVYTGSGGWLPMVTSRESHIAMMRESAQKIATAGGQTVKLLKLTTRTVIETFNPETGDSHAETR